MMAETMDGFGASKNTGLNIIKEKVDDFGGKSKG